jgi:hypothetical protein
MDIQTQRVDEAPETADMQPGVLYIWVADGQTVPWLAILLCPCGCGEPTHLCLLFDGDGPSWKLHSEDPAHVEPSVQKTTGCRSHYWIRSGQVVWC